MINQMTNIIDLGPHFGPGNNPGDYRLDCARVHISHPMNRYAKSLANLTNMVQLGTTNIGP